ncbi:hypothetical protein GJU39_10825 [Pedobacter petrophilus]|uniref:Uncharacterized protein n=1 Tax=Pedobacter petrophilus TaxID=1908241 RepID=A0A7K0FYI7_9SPHI|nr:hypothetical protein [Pedobacter petrophilus]MRX76585.1 hypothetical protein [Pedobacter petrophilus]
MGFGLALLFIFIIFPTTIILLVLWISTKKRLYGKILGLFWTAILLLIITSSTWAWFTAKKVLKKEDYYGEYIINRDYFPGKQADWQYDHYRFEIKRNDSIFFYVTDRDKILKTFRGKIVTSAPYRSVHIKPLMEEPTYHIMEAFPTTYRSAWSFYLVFYSSKFNNVYFKKGHWKQLKD